VRFKGIEGEKSRFVIPKWICRGSRVLIFNLVKEVRSISPSLLIKNDNNTRMILLILRTTTSVSLPRLPFKHKKRLATLNSICKDRNLKSTLPLVVPAFALLKTNCPISLLSVSTALKKLEWKR
jgi:hypothetical protein